MATIAHKLPHTIAILGGGLLALCAIVAAGVGSFVLVLGVCSARVVLAPVRRRRMRITIERAPSRARAAVRAEPAL